MVTRGGGHDYDHHVPPKFLQIKQEDKFFSRLLSKETSREASFRVLYYGGAAGAIPFMWESRPGTPKHTLSDTSLPPLTPPPSYQISTTTPHYKHNKPSISMPKFLQFLRMARKEKSSGTSTTADSASFSSSSFSSSYSTPSSSTPVSSCTSRRNKSSRAPDRSSSESDHAVHFGLDEDTEDEQIAISPTSTLCIRTGTGSGSKFRSYYGMKNMKKTVLSCVGHATAQKCS